MRVDLVIGPPASGKTTFVEENFNLREWDRLNRDELGGQISQMVPMLKAMLANGHDVVLDNLFATVESRRPFIEVAKQFQAELNCIYIGSDINDCMLNACQRMMKNHGRILDPEEIKNSKNPNDIPPAVFFKYRKSHEPPSAGEGFDSIRVVKGYRWTPSWKTTNWAIIFDYDGTLRVTEGGNGKYPTHPDQVKLLPGRKEKLAKLKANGNILLGISNQSGIGGGTLTEKDALECFRVTNFQLGQDIDVHFCPHKAGPISCFCRKPQPGFGVYLTEHYHLDPKRTTVVGDQTTDKTFAQRCGFEFVHADEFFS